MQRPVPRNKSVKFSPGTSEDGSDDDSARHAIKPRRSARSLKPGHLSIQPGLSNAHLILRRYTALDEFGAVSDLSDDEQELLNSPKVAPAQPIDRYVMVSSILQAVRSHYRHPLFCCTACNSLQACAEQPSIMLSTATRAHSAACVNVMTPVQQPCKCPDDWLHAAQRTDFSLHAGTHYKPWCHLQMHSWLCAVLVLMERRKVKGLTRACCQPR